MAGQMCDGEDIEDDEPSGLYSAHVDDGVPSYRMHIAVYALRCYRLK